MDTVARFDLNGTAPAKAPKRPAKARSAPEAGKPTAKAPRANQALPRGIAYGAFAVAGGLLVLSLAHLTEAISALTGSHWFLSLLLAVGIDAGMAVSEGLLLTAPEESEASRWATWYVIATIAVSALLNAYGFALHAPPGPLWFGAIALGLFVPLAVFALLKAGGKAYLGK